MVARVKLHEKPSALSEPVPATEPAPADQARAVFEETPDTLLIRGVATKVARLRLSDKTIVATDNLTILEEMDLSEALKATQLSNPVFIEWATHAACVRVIDGDPVAFPGSEGQVKAIIKRVGDDLMRMLLMRKNARQQALFAEIERAKKSQGTPDSETPST